MQIRLPTTTPNLFDVLGVKPALGRTFTRQEINVDRVVLSHATWTRLGADPAIVGRDVWMSGSPYIVIGVMPSDYRFVRHSTIGVPLEPDVYVPTRNQLAKLNPNPSYGTLIRVAPGTSRERAMATVTAAGRAANERLRPNRPYQMFAVGLHADLIAPVKPVLLALGIAGAFLLIVLTVNLASLLLARAAARERELAVSRAVGANGMAIARAMLTEGVFLGLAGGVTGAIAGWWVRGCWRRLPRRPSLASRRSPSTEASPRSSLPPAHCSDSLRRWGRRSGPPACRSDRSSPPRRSAAPRASRPSAAR